MSRLQQSRLQQKWSCNEAGNHCYYKRGNNNVWGVVIQIRGNQFSYLRLMDHRDSRVNIHPNLHNIYWAKYSRNGWELIGPIIVPEDDKRVGSETRKAFSNPPPLPVGQWFPLPRINNF